jgi:putative two-component system response regulator
MSTLYELNELKASLEIQVNDRTKELDKEKQSYKMLTLETLSSLAELIDAKDHYTNGHSFRVAAYAKALAIALGYKDEAEKIYLAGLIHDVGKIGISEAILTKPGKLTEDEYHTIQSHAPLGGNILRGLHQFRIFKEVARSHHERWDGNGYPDKLKGEQIPLEARIVAVCDVYDAMTSDRSYRKALSDKAALAELERVKGSQLDPRMVDAFIKICESYPDSIRNHIDELVQ